MTAKLKLTDPRIKVGADYSSYESAMRDVARSASSENTPILVAITESSTDTSAPLLETSVSISPEGKESIHESSGEPARMLLEVSEWTAVIDGAAPRTVRGLDGILRFAAQMALDSKGEVHVSVHQISREPLTHIFHPGVQDRLAFAATVSQRPHKLIAQQPATVQVETLSPAEEPDVADEAETTIPRRPTIPPTVPPIPLELMEGPDPIPEIPEATFVLMEPQENQPIAERKTGKRLSVRTGVVAGVVAVALLCGGGITLSNFLNGTQSVASSPTSTPQSELLPGWSGKAHWSLPVKPGSPPALATDGQFAAVPSADNMLTIYALGGEPAKLASIQTTETPIPVIVDGKAGFIAGTEGTLQLWVDGAKEFRGIDLTKDQKLIIRGNRPFTTASDNTSKPTAITAASAQLYTPPNPQSVPITLTGENQMVWSGTKNRLFIAGPDGLNAKEVTLETPPDTKALTRVVSVAGPMVLTIWGDSIIALHELSTGKLATSATADPALAPKASITASSNSPVLAFAGQLIDTANASISPLPAGAKPLSAIGTMMFADQPSGRVLIQPGHDPIPVPTGTTPLAIDAKGNLIVITDNKLQAHASTDTPRVSTPSKN